jgi:hypothetical protein
MSMKSVHDKRVEWEGLAFASKATAHPAISYHSIILFKWQSLLDNARIIYADQHCSDQIVKQMQTRVHPVRINLPGRKEYENDTTGRFCIFIGKDAVAFSTVGAPRPKYFSSTRDRVGS